jgi:hypothetical protein
LFLVLRKSYTRSNEHFHSDVHRHSASILNHHSLSHKIKSQEAVITSSSTMSITRLLNILCVCVSFANALVKEDNRMVRFQRARSSSRRTKCALTLRQRSGCLSRKLASMPYSSAAGSIHSYHAIFCGFVYMESIQEHLQSDVRNRHTAHLQQCSQSQPDQRPSRQRKENCVEFRWCRNGRKLGGRRQ